MKKVFLNILIAIFVSIGCTRNEELPDPSDDEINMLVDGTYLETNDRVVIGQSTVDGGANYGFTIYGRSSSGISFSGSFTYDAEIGIGTYVCEKDGLDGGAIITNYFGKTYLGGFESEENTFTFTIINFSGNGINRKFEGTFSGKMMGETPRDIITITNGYFSNM